MIDLIELRTIRAAVRLFQPAEAVNWEEIINERLGVDGREDVELQELLGDLLPGSVQSLNDFADQLEADIAYMGDDDAASAINDCLRVRALASDLELKLNLTIKQGLGPGGD